jgi:hypothetical protein
MFQEDLKKWLNFATFLFQKYEKYMLPLTEEQLQKHNKAEVYENCETIFTKDNPKCRHHDHTTGEYIGAICRRCNFRLDRKKHPTSHHFPQFQSL